MNLVKKLIKIISKLLTTFLRFAALNAIVWKLVNYFALQINLLVLMTTLAFNELIRTTKNYFIFHCDITAGFFSFFNYHETIFSVMQCFSDNTVQ